jgi:hypothetical protein
MNHPVHSNPKFRQIRNFLKNHLFQQFHFPKNPKNQKNPKNPKNLQNLRFR